MYPSGTSTSNEAHTCSYSKYIDKVVLDLKEEDYEIYVILQCPGCGNIIKRKL